MGESLLMPDMAFASAASRSVRENVCMCGPVSASLTNPVELRTPSVAVPRLIALASFPDCCPCTPARTKQRMAVSRRSVHLRAAPLARVAAGRAGSPQGH